MRRPEKRIDFSMGDEVEVCSKRHGFLGSNYYEARVVWRLENGLYIVEYNSLLDDDDNYKFLTKTVYPKDLRPLPPKVPFPSDGLLLYQIVDAPKDEGWWVSVVTGKRGFDEYYVYSEITDQDVLFHYSQLRVHQEWTNGNWVLSQEPNFWLNSPPF